MIERTLGQITHLAGGKLNDEDFSDIMSKGCSIDTRTITDGNIYMPIIGKKLDGHKFINQAFNKGAVASFIDENHKLEDYEAGKAYITVEDTTKAFKNLAKNYRASLDDIKIIGITGSNGKTSIKDISFSILSQKYRVKKTIGNLNNTIGVPKTLLALDENTEFGVVEMGTDGFGQIHELSTMARPDFAVISNIGDSHLELLGSKENIARAKFEILDGLNPEGTFIYNSDDEVLCKIIKEYKIDQKVITFGYNENADYRLELVSSNITGSTFKINGEAFKINLIGQFQVYNAAPAIIIAKLLGLSSEEISRGLEVEDRTAMRNELIECNGFDILNDSYKSNPQSLEQAFNTMSLLSGYTKKIAIIADMLELGEDEVELHRQAGRKINPRDIDYILFIGNLSKYIMEGTLEHFPKSRVYHFASKEDLVDEAKYLIERGTLVLVKGSRAMRLEEIVESIKDITT